MGECYTGRPVARPFLSDGAKTALAEAVRAIETASRAEVVVVVRARSAPYREAAFAGGLLAALLTLAFMLFSPWPFDLAWFLVDPLVLGVAGGLLVARVAVLTRVLTSARARGAAVRNAARLAFLDRGVTATRERTGVLVYVSLLERAADVVADLGIAEAVPPDAWEAAVASMRAVVAAGGDGVALAARVGALSELLADARPAGPDEVNELPDEVAAP
jgi:putative membrane protein